MPGRIISRMKRQFYPNARSRSRPRQQTPRSCPQSRRHSLSTDEVPNGALNLESLNDGLISILECPVCFETMLPPIFQCKEGHNVCHGCKEKIKSCPLCRQLLVGRNVTVEHISNKLLRHCSNKDSGCKELVSLDTKEQHELICPFRKYDCLPGEDRCPQSLDEVTRKTKNCYYETLLTLDISAHKSDIPLTKQRSLSVWSLPMSSTNCIYGKDGDENQVQKINCLNSYVLNPEEHKILRLEKPDQGLDGLNSSSWIKNLSSAIRRKSVDCIWSGVRFEILGHMKAAHPEMANIGREIFDVNKAKHEISLIPALDEVFWLHLKRDPRKKLFYALVAYIGPIANAANYLYKFTVYSRVNGNKVSFTYQTPSDTCNVDELFINGEAAVMSYKALKPFIDVQKKLPWKLKIKEVEKKI